MADKSRKIGTEEQRDELCVCVCGCSSKATALELDGHFARRAPCILFPIPTFPPFVLLPNESRALAQSDTAAFSSNDSQIPLEPFPAVSH